MELTSGFRNQIAPVRRHVPPAIHLRLLPLLLVQLHALQLAHLVRRSTQPFHLRSSLEKRGAVGDEDIVTKSRSRTEAGGDVFGVFAVWVEFRGGGKGMGVFVRFGLLDG